MKTLKEKELVSHSDGLIKININGQDCDSIAITILNEVRNLIFDDKGIWLSLDEVFEKIDEIYLDERGCVEDYTYVP